jgi:hypothetical protein
MRSLMPLASSESAIRSPRHAVHVRALRHTSGAEHFVCVDRGEVLLHPPNLAIANDEEEMLSELPMQW